MAILTNAKAGDVTLTDTQTLTNKTLTSPTISDPTITGTTTNINTTNLVVEDKNIVINDVTSPTDANADGGGISLNGGTTKTINYVNATAAWTSSEHFNIASGKEYRANGTALKDVSETLANKTLTTPVISSISNTGTLTLPTSTDTLVGRATTDTLTNKTLTSPSIDGGTLVNSVIRGIEEDVEINTTAPTGTINIDVNLASVHFFTTAASANFTLNFRFSSSVSLNTSLATGDAITIVTLITNGVTARFPNIIQIDGSTVTPKVPSAITAGNASAIDAYSFTIIKTASATFTVLETQTKFA